MRVEGRGEKYGVLHFKINESSSLGMFLINEVGLSEERANELINLGAVYVNESRATSSEQWVHANDQTRVHTEPRRFERFPARAQIIFENSELLVINKPSGIPVHALTDNLKENVIAYLEEELDKRILITHRLDVATSGLLVLAKTPEAQAGINRDIAEGRIKRAYKALVEKEVLVGEYRHWMEPSPSAPKKVESLKRTGWLECRLQIQKCTSEISSTHLARFAAQLSNFTPYELEIELMTGRSQQIRAQLAALDAPILGDCSYGGCAIEASPNGIALQAYALTLPGGIELAL